MGCFVWLEGFMPREFRLRGEVLIKVMISVVFLAKMLGLLWWKSWHSVEHFEKQQCIANNQIFNGNHHVRSCQIKSASANHQKTKFAPISPLSGTQNFMKANNDYTAKWRVVEQIWASNSNAIFQRKWKATEINFPNPRAVRRVSRNW